MTAGKMGCNARRRGIEDLLAVEACYHRDCMSLFFNSRKCMYDSLPQLHSLKFFDTHLVKAMSADKSYIWYSLQEYQNNRGLYSFLQKSLIAASPFSSELVISGYSSSVAFQCNAAVL